MITKEQLVCTKDRSDKIVVLFCKTSTVFSWQSFTDMHGRGWTLEERMSDNDIPAHTTAELIDLIPPMKGIKRFLFIWRTMMEPNKVADYLINTK